MSALLSPHTDTFSSLHTPHHAEITSFPRQASRTGNNFPGLGCGWPRQGGGIRLCPMHVHAPRVPGNWAGGPPCTGSLLDSGLRVRLSAACCQRQRQPTQSGPAAPSSLPHLAPVRCMLSCRHWRPHQHHVCDHYGHLVATVPPYPGHGHVDDAQSLPSSPHPISQSHLHGVLQATLHGD